MALSFLDNVDYRGKKPNFERDQFETIAKMAEFDENYLPDTFIATCIEDGKAYLFNRSNEIDSRLGKWRLLNPAMEGASVLNSDLTALSSIGGIAANKIYTSGTSLESILIDLLSGRSKEEEFSFYYGVSDDNKADFDVDVIYEMNNLNAITFTAKNQYLLFICPADKEIEIYDDNGLNNTSSFTTSEFDINGVAYTVYCSEAKVTCVNYRYRIVY